MQCIKVLFLSLLLVSPTVQANTTTQELAHCMADHLNGPERRALARWVFFALAAHPEMQPYTHISAQDIERSDKYIGELTTRLFVEDCPNAMKAALAAQPTALIDAFGLLGGIVTQELMADKAVTDYVAGYSKHLNEEKIVNILSKP
ncbi:hypothetical protein [Neptunomonas sp. XY-337]|uniref:hypothetical protein n=1 Tax=Neptunomonas sp. XY-337 TaxID=2561897 RepID=UPI00197F35E8|nr:hypothetical protein [Neptunomonas sp. XY-337]